ncbi:SusC/RagA family TonB-linked outer membrane protein [Mucilaginibacter sp. UR6-11]|uniref:SusC/RagA family TonB-linked outer membrane protein n=1 Tax=Mucilaginibacter sp. UR6-11 TaxID=1435644 RepID=UPI001E48CDD3|nr:SusC/RagA family TonB-linked outer membrane protein [Mucilaginibacter sp. UR6-11]MCC8424903.1 SusC/RagA family TonB-linked outer membrane protein [Mucilaginibacter sp. UR6-11]
MKNFYGKLLPILRKCMRIATIIIGIQVCCTALLAAKGTRAQEMNLNVDKASVKQVFKRIEQQASVTFVYDAQVINSLPALTLHINKQPLAQVLTQLHQLTQLQFKLVGNFIGVAQNVNSMPALSLANTDNTKSTIKITGVVRDASGQPLIGVTVTLKGTQAGTQTNVNGQFAIDANVGDVLTFSYIGYLSKEITITSPASLSVLLDEDSKQLSEVVVTALGIKKERKALGYSITEVKGDELTQAREPNVMNSLEGKVAGLNVSPTAGGPGSSSNVIIRGVSSLTQTTQPLYVVNGVPMDNTPNSAPGQQYDNQSDMGDAIGNLNPDDIETISVLKGAAASALYGYRGKAGVILITTKSGKGNSIEFNSNYVAEKAINSTNWQYTYGQGANGIKPADATTAYQSGQSSWGARLDGSNVVQFDGVARPYTAQKNNIQNFYRIGQTATNTIALNRSFEGGSVRFSASDLTNNAITPNSGLNRQTFNLTANYNITKRFTVDVRNNYILEQAHNRPFLSDGPGNSNYNVTLLPTSVDVNVLKKTVNPNGSEYGYSGNVYATNPWFAAEKFINNTNRERLISSATLRYNFDDGYFIQGRAGRDAYNDRFTAVVPTGTAYRPLGTLSESTTNFSDINTDILLGKTYKLNDFTLIPNIGGSYRRTKSELFTMSGNNFIVPNVYVITNIAQANPLVYTPSDQEVESLYGTLELDYKDYLYLTGSIRNDWYSTLATPGINNPLNKVYPSVNGSFVFSNFVQNDWLSFGKLRAGFAQVGQATSPYQTQLAYNFNGSVNGGPLGVIANANVPNSSLVASLATELEIGTEMRFLNDRLNLDLTWYNKNSKDEIVAAPASITSGYGGAILNIGKLQNRGVEALISGIPFKTSSFKWTTSFNGSINNNKVISLAAGQTSLPGATSRTGNGFTQDIVGLPVNQIMAFDYKRDGTGAIVKDAAGIPVQGDLKPYGSAYAKWIAGWNNEFSYKRFTLSFLIDGKFGGKIFSATNYYGYVFGLHQATLVNRETLGTAASTYYTTLATNVSSLFVQDATFIKLRQATLGYNFPVNLLHGAIKTASISLVARNLFYLLKRTDNIDPESDYSYNAEGLELGGVPATRTYGLNLNVKF